MCGGYFVKTMWQLLFPRGRRQIRAPPLKLREFLSSLSLFSSPFLLLFSLSFVVYMLMRDECLFPLPFAFSRLRKRERERETISCVFVLCRRLRKMPVGVFVRLKSLQWDGYAVAPGASPSCPRDPSPHLTVAIDCPSTPR